MTSKTSRLLMLLIAAAGVIAIAPRLRSAMDTVTPTFTQTNLVSDVAGMAKTMDPNLVNPWGMSLGLNSGIWVSDNGSGKATTYDGAGKPLPSATPLTVTIPSAGTVTANALPTGTVLNATTGFVISSAGKSAPASELFVTLQGTIAGWNASVDPTNAVIAVDNSTSGVAYTGLAQGFNGSGTFLYAVNFHDGTVDVFDSTFQLVRNVGAFQDPELPAGYVPFGISAINGRLYVTYALQAANKRGEVRAPGNGFIDIFDTEGNLVKRFASQGHLNAPWGMAWAPFEGFAKFNNALFVGNFGDGTINAFDFDSGDFLGTVSDASGKPINNPGIWALQFGLGVAGATSDTLFFTAGIAAEQHGLLGALKVNSSSLPPAQGPTMVDPKLTVTTVVPKLDQPTGMVFLGDSDFLVIEKASGKVQHVVKGAIIGTALDLAVNSASERGLLGIALQPDFAQSHGVYLYWTESSTGVDSANLADVPLLGNRVDRYIWNPATETLVFDKNIIMLHAFQADAGQPMRGNHDGGKTVFGPDGKLYIQIGDQGRRGQLQNLASGPFGPGQPDDQFGGPAPDNAHLTGVILRLNPDGTIPADNPFAKVTMQDMAAIEQRAGMPPRVFAQLGEIVTNVHKIFSYGRRNGFGLAFDPATGFLWESENGDDTFDEMNHITAGANGGWIQIMGPARLVADFKQIETSFTPLQGNLPVAGNIPFTAIDPANLIPASQQVRWPPSLIADSRSEARSRLFVLPGSHYEDPEFSWKWAVAPAAIGFAGSGLGSHSGNLFVGAARTFLDEGYLFEFKFDDKRQHFAFSDSKLKDRVDNNHYKFDEGQSTSLVAGKNFGIVTDIVTGPDGALYVTSLSNGAVYMIR